MQHFLKDLTLMLSGMAFHAADTHRATSEGAARLIFPVSVNSRAGSAIQVRYCCLNLSLKRLLMDTSIGYNTDVIPPGMTTSSVFILRSWFFAESVRCPLNASRTSIDGWFKKALGLWPPYYFQSLQHQLLLHPSFFLGPDYNVLRKCLWFG